ncbi:hypothetical protein [Variovorax sp. RA8]|uniref:hypothetical protein n=1 Tax=Variovorax sp. (strain JCM 16519 / RA8) TaxID=662548 RepID=UPI000AF586F8|nr:hypothetical protein [Variovorax sp. RA8]VTU16862.1 hypothetical protein RA8CHR_01374 [Variovorax sp. RA8]
MNPTACKMQAQDECVIVGGCNGLHWIPVAQQADYYRAQKLMAMLGLVCMPVLLFLL